LKLLLPTNYFFPDLKTSDPIYKKKGRIMIGRTVSHYRIIDKIDFSGIAVVYKIEDTKLKRPEALKYLIPPMTVNKDTRQRFVNKAKSASLLGHFSICTIFEISADDGERFIVRVYSSGKIIMVIWQPSLHIILVLLYHKTLLL
jgi:serine/threonine protein kinase